MDSPVFFYFILALLIKKCLFFIVAAYIRSMIFAVNSPSLYVKLLAPPFLSVIWRMD